MESGGQARGAGHASCSSRPQRSASPISRGGGGFRAAVSDVGHKLQEFYTFDLMPRALIVKFRQRVQGIQLGANFEFHGVQVDGMQLQKCNADDCHTKLVIKPSSENGYWKVICEPKQRDLRILTKKIPIGSLLHFQPRGVHLASCACDGRFQLLYYSTRQTDGVRPGHEWKIFVLESQHGLNTWKQFGIGHDFIRNSTGWKWKVTSAFGLPGSPEVRQKTKLPVFPGFDINVDWNAQYELPELRGASGTGEPPIEANLGHLHAKIERVAAVYTHVG